MNGGIYITCQAMPKFDSIDVGAVDCRVQEFKTRKLVTKDMTAPAWMLEHSFECLMWLVNMLVIHRDLIKPEELFYERPHDVSAGARLNIDMTEEKARQLIECTGSTDEEDGEIETGKLSAFRRMDCRSARYFFFNFDQIKTKRESKVRV